MTKLGASYMAESTSELGAPEGIRTPNLLIRSYGPMVRSGTTLVALSRRSRRREARLWLSLSAELSSAHGAKVRHFHRLLIAGDPALTIGCVKDTDAVASR